MINHLKGFLNKCVLAFKRDNNLETSSSMKQKTTARPSVMACSVWDNDRGTRHSCGLVDSESRMTCFEVIMPLKLQSTKILIYSV